MQLASIFNISFCWQLFNTTAPFLKRNWLSMFILEAFGLSCMLVLLIVELLNALCTFTETETTVKD